MTRAPDLSDDGDLGIAGDGDAGHFGRRIGMGDAAADRAAIADLVMRDMGDRGLEQRMRGREPLVVFDVAPAHHGAERRRPASEILMPRRSASLRRSTSNVGWASRKASIGTRLWPPAIALASPSCEARSWIASGSVVGQA